MKSILLIIIILTTPVTFRAQVFKGPYLGQQPPGMQPELFAPELFMKTQPEWVFCTEFTADGKEFYFSENDTAKDMDRIMVMEQENGVWSRPVPVPFTGRYNDHDQRLSPDGNTIFWRSWRPLPGSIKPEERPVIWFATRTPRGWSEAKPVMYGSTYLRAGYPSITRDGMLYFSARLEGNIGASDIHCCRFMNGICEEPRNLGATINTEYIEGDLLVAPDESFLIVSCWNRPDNNGDSDLYISFRKNDGTWTALKNMGEPVNSERNENCPSLSPDGKYFLYMSAEINEDKPSRTYTYWVDVRILERYQAVTRQ